MRLALAVSLMAACGNSAATLDAAGVDVDAPLADAAIPADAPLTPGLNRVFVSSTSGLGNFGGLVAADARCQADAVAAGLAGTFIAWLSTSSVNARDRFADGSRGWVRVDGAPVIDTMQKFITNNQMFNPVLLDATGVPARGVIWTGTGADGRHAPGYSCNNWTSLPADAYIGNSGASMPDFVRDYTWPCYSMGAFFCFEIGRYSIVAPSPGPADARIAFISKAKRTVPGIPSLDAICAAEAAAAQLPGSYLAAVPTTSASVASRFVIDARPWRRIDGTLVAGSELLTATVQNEPHYASFVNQHADGTYTAEGVLGGAIDPTSLGYEQSTCEDWERLDQKSYYDLGSPTSTRVRAFWDSTGFVPCVFPSPVLCLQE